MKKFTSIKLLASALTLSLLLAACGQTAPTTSGAAATTAAAAESSAAVESSAAATTAAPAEVKNQIIVGTTTEPSGDYATPYWQNNATDAEINNHLLGGYGTVALSVDGEFSIDETVVKEWTAETNEDGTKTYTYTINDGLTYSDGTPITAKDYVAGAMFFSSKALGDIGAKISSSTGAYYVGYEEFSKGVADEATGKVLFKGVRLLGDMEFSVTLAKEYTPTFFELSSVGVGPLPLDFWANNPAAGKVEIKDDGQGCYFSDNFTAENFKDSVEKARKDPTIPTSGPYVVESFDAANNVITLKINPKYVGDQNGVKPSIETVIYKKVTRETMMDELKTGAVDLLSNLMSGDEINAAFNLMDEVKDKYDYINYPRAAFGKINFICDNGPTQFVEVRQAIAHLLDRNDFVKAFTSGYGTVVNGPYGEGQWVYKESQAELNKTLNTYSYSLDDAIKLLDGSGWNLNDKGEAYAGTGLRYKDVDGTLMPLEINWCSSEKNPVSELLVTKLQKNPDLEKAGIKINQEVMTFDELLNYLYRDVSQGEKYGEKRFGMFNLTSGFPAAYTPKDDYTTDPEKLANGYNTNYIVDAELEQLATSYWKVDPTDRAGYRAGWMKFVERWNQLLPDLPLYSNTIHDVFDAKLKGFENSPYVNVAYGLARAHVE